MKPKVNGTNDGTTKPKTRRTRSPHPGVVLLKPDATHTSWRARYVDPDTGKMVKERLNPVELSNADLRRHWAIKKAKAVAQRAQALKDGAVPTTGKDLKEVIQLYYAAHPRLRPATVTAYKGATDKLIAWAEENGALLADNLTRPLLMDFRAWLAALPKKTAIKGGKQGKRRATDKLRSPLSVNRELRATQTVLTYLCDRDAFARLTRDDLRIALKREKVTHEKLGYLRPTELRELIEAALRHDAEMFGETRKEHIGLKPRGTTPRYEAIAPMVIVTLMSGMRLSEALALEWPHVDLTTRDLAGREVGEINLEGRTNKTHKARTIDLAVSPMLRELLAVMRLKSGGQGSVLGLTHGLATAAGKRLRREYGAPKAFTWQSLRRTCGTFLTCSPGIFAAASAFRSAAQLGHGVEIAQRHYVNIASGIDRSAHDLETAMDIRDEVQKVIDAVGGKVEHGNVRSIGGAA